MLRVAFYCHDTYGLGHLQRCLKLASSFSRSFSSVEGLILTGSPWQSGFRAPTGFHLVGLPPVKKEGQGAYVSRIPDLDLRTTLALRRERIEATLEAFRPDLLIVDNVPCGLAGEILPALRRYRGRGTVAVLALRDVLDRPEAILEEWTRAGAAEPLEELYDEIWVFGDDGDLGRLIAFGPLASVAAKVHSCGYVGGASGFGADDPGRTSSEDVPASTKDRRPHASSPPRSRPMVLITGGGGGDAFELIRTYAFEFAPQIWQLIVGGTLLIIIMFLPDGLWSILARLRRARA